MQITSIARPGQARQLATLGVLRVAEFSARRRQLVAVKSLLGKKRHPHLRGSGCEIVSCERVVCTHTRAHPRRTHTHMHARTHTHTHTHTHTCIHTHTRTRTQHAHATCTHTHVHAYARAPSARTRVHTHAHTYIETCTHTHAHTQVPRGHECANPHANLHE